MTELATRHGLTRGVTIHPGSWWIWALLLAAAATRTSNPLLLLVTLTVAGLVARTHQDPDGTGGFSAFLKLGLLILAIRTVFHLLLGGAGGTHLLFTLPQLPLPHWLSGIRLGGPVFAEGLIGTLYDALRLAVLLCCIGAAVSLANPRRLLSGLPGALYEVGVAVVVAMSLAPELLTVAARVRRARELRGDGITGRGPRQRIRAWTRVALPVLAESTDRALALAASMDARGYGRTTGISRRSRLTTGALILLGLAGLCLGVYGLLDAGGTAAATIPALTIGVAATIGGLVLGSRRVQRTRYRRSSWGAADLLVIAAGAAALATSMAAGWLGVELHPVDLLSPPGLPVLPFLGLLLAAAPLLLRVTR